jgi:hypothetical protein
MSNLHAVLGHSNRYFNENNHLYTGLSGAIAGLVWGDSPPRHVDAGDKNATRGDHQ